MLALLITGAFFVKPYFHAARARARARAARATFAVLANLLADALQERLDPRRAETAETAAEA